jgi:hypothetical protein
MADEQAGGKKRSAWMSHVKKTMKANKGKPLSAVLKMAAKTYKKAKGGNRMMGGEVSQEAGNPPVGAVEGQDSVGLPTGGLDEGSQPTLGGRRKTRKGRKSRKSRKSRRGAGYGY